MLDEKEANNANLDDYSISVQVIETSHDKTLYDLFALTNKDRKPLKV